MKSIAYIPGSNGAGNASQMTVQNVRSPGASDILVNTVTGVSTKFYGSMGAPHTFTDPVTSETITIISEATAVDFAGHVDTGKLVIDAIAPGYVDTRGSLVGDIVVIRPNTEWANNLFNVLGQSLNDDGTIKDTAITYQPTISDYIQSGGVWSTVSGLNGAMTSLTGWQGGHLNTVALITSRTFTVSKDTYIDVLRNTVTNAFSIVYTEVANAAASPALAANSIRLAKVVTSGAAITSIVQSGIDSLSNTIKPSGSIGASNIDFSSFISRQNDTTNTAPGGIRVETGWGTITGNNLTIISEQVTFKTPFTSVPIILVSGAGGMLSIGAAYPDTTGAYDDNLMCSSAKQTAASFYVYLARAAGATFGSTTSVFYTWIAIGA